ncbi:hypothetical protein DVH05_006179 [Phytophthora capsici]|nr:hypothetical protein DVH05_006179 [Phytophthora capsici]
MSTIAFRELYRYGVVANALLLSVGVVMAGIGGVLFPCMALVFGDAVGAFARADGGVDVDAGLTRQLWTTFTSQWLCSSPTTSY